MFSLSSNKTKNEQIGQYQTTKPLYNKEKNKQIEKPTYKIGKNTYKPYIW